MAAHVFPREWTRVGPDQIRRRCRRTLELLPERCGRAGLLWIASIRAAWRLKGFEMNWRVFVSLIAAVLASSPTFAVSPGVQNLISKAASQCAALESGRFDPRDAVTAIERRSPSGSVAAEIVDESAYSCSAAASMYCGSGGCNLNLVVGDRIWSWQTTGWRLVDWGPSRILLIGRDGGWCGGAGSEVCFEALVWSDGKILTVGPAPESR